VIKFLLGCFWIGFKGLLATVAFLLIMGVPVYLGLDVSPWFFLISVVEVCVLVGLLEKASRR